MGAKKIKLFGNLKFSESDNEKNNIINNKLKKIFKFRKIWCAASTHDTEEKLSALAHKKLKKKYKDLLTIVIPRHVQRANDIINETKDLDLNVQTRSSSNKINNNTDIYLVDTYGESKSFYKICKTVFLGGSLVNHGGQNPIEAARFGCKIIHGPYVQNFTEVYKLLKTNNISFKIKNIEQLVHRIDKSFLKKTNFSKKTNKLKKLGSIILSKTYSELDNYL